MILAIESATMTASVAFVEEDRIVAEFTLNDKMTHSQTIMPLIETMEKLTGRKISDLEAIAVSGGPGSYTGLRIGSATAKALAHVLELPIINISTLEVLAAHFLGDASYICVMMDARRNHAFTCIYKCSGDALEPIIEKSLLSYEEIGDILKSIEGKLILTGDGLSIGKVYLDKVLEGQNVYFAAYSQNLPRAGVLGQLAYKALKNGNTETYMAHVPNYLRPSQAERELNKQHDI